MGSFTPFFSFTSLSLSTFPFPRIHIDAGGEGDSDGSWMALWDLGIKKELGKRLSLFFDNSNGPLLLTVPTEFK